MNDRMLNDYLNRLEVPPPDPAAEERALVRARLALKTRQPEQVVPRRWFVWALSLSSALAVMLLYTTFFKDHSRPGRSALFMASSTGSSFNEQSFAKEAQVFREVYRLFPTNLRAVVSEGNDSRLVLGSADSKQQGQGEIVVLRLERGERELTVVSFSGQSFSLRLNGEEEEFEVLVSGSGAVLVSGKDFIWSPEKRSQAHGYSINAKSLGIEL